MKKHNEYNGLGRGKYYLFPSFPPPLRTQNWTDKHLVQAGWTMIESKENEFKKFFTDKKGNKFVFAYARELAQYYDLEKGVLVKNLRFRDRKKFKKLIKILRKAKKLK